MGKTLASCLVLWLLLGLFLQAFAANPKGEGEVMRFQELNISITGTATTKADYFAGNSPRAVILAPGAMFSKESWHFLAERLQELGIASVALNSGSTPDLLNALAFLKAEGSKNISILGASAGGAGVLYALQGDIVDPLVDSVILLAPAGGLPIKNREVKKLFIVTEDDMISSNAEVYKLYRDSSDPKLYHEFTGSEHAQRLFNGKHKEETIQLIIDFIGN